MSHHSAASAHGHGDSHEGGHVVPVKTFTIIFGLLVVLTAVTIYAAGIDFGDSTINLVISMIIASIKALLVILFFMHLKYENPVTWLYAIFPIILLFVLMGGVFIDNPLRDTPQPVSVNVAEK
jgi:cytochrome c oxidase subunit IV